MRRSLLSIAIALAGASASAQTPAPPPPQALGSVTEIQGLVTMSLGSQVATVQTNTPVFDGARFVTSSSGTAEIKLTNGQTCLIDLKPNQMVTIDSAYNCRQQISAIQSIGDTLAGGSSFIGRDGIALVGAAALAAAVGRIKDPEITPRRPD
jgi:hypothetical protein